MNWLLIALGFSLLVLLHEGGHYFAAKATGMRVERFFLFFGPTLWSFRRGETEYGIKAIPIGGFVTITGMNPEEDVPPEHRARSYSSQAVWKRIVVVAAGPVVNIVLAFAILTVVYFFNAQQADQTVGEIRGGTPAAKVLQPGDRVVAVDGKTFSGLSLEKRLTRFGEEVSSHKCAGKLVDGCTAASPVALTIERKGQERTILVKPEYDKAAGRALIGFSYGGTPTTISPGTAFSRAADSVWLVAERTATIFSRIFEEEQRKQISGIVGISDAANQTIDRSAVESFLLLALVSLSLGLINLLPILPLDGGHIFWALVEKVRGRPASLRAIERATAVGVVLVVLLMVIGLTNDIGRLGTDAYSAR
jgi:regulator of sigma E protease